MAAATPSTSGRRTNTGPNYAHLSAYAPGLAEGQQIQRGQVIGNVGHTGDANAAGPHLHFAINQMNAGERWWQGTPINPYPLLAGKKTNG